MSKVYRKNAKGRMTRVIYKTSAFWLLLSLIFICFGFSILLIYRILLNWFNVEILVIICMITVLLGVLLMFVPIFKLFNIIKCIKKIGSISKYFYYERSKKAIEDGLLSAGLVRKIVSENVVEVPSCAIVEDKEHTYIIIERLPSLSDIEKVAKAVNSSLRKGKFLNYAITEMHETADGLYYRFEIENVNNDKTFRPRNISDLIPENPYEFKLMNGLIWNYPTQSHAILSGLTGSRKSSTMRIILAQALGVGADIYILDFKSEMIGFKPILGDNHVVSSPIAILELLECLVVKMHERHQKIAAETVKKGLLGATGADFNARPVFIIAEELGGLTQAYTDAKERKRFQECLQTLAMLGRSCLYELILIVQVASVEYSTSALKSNTNLKILLGKSTSEMVTQVFSSGYADSVSLNPGVGRGYIFLNGETTAPILFFAPDLYRFGLDKIVTYEKLYNVGRNRIYNEKI